MSKPNTTTESGEAVSDTSSTFSQEDLTPLAIRWFVAITEEAAKRGSPHVARLASLAIAEDADKAGLVWNWILSDATKALAEGCALFPAIGVREQAAKRLVGYSPENISDLLCFILRLTLEREAAKKA